MFQVPADGPVSSDGGVNCPSVSLPGTAVPASHFSLGNYIHVFFVGICCQWLGDLLCLPPDLIPPGWWDVRTCAGRGILGMGLASEGRIYNVQCHLSLAESVPRMIPDVLSLPMVRLWVISSTNMLCIVSLQSCQMSTSLSETISKLTVYLTTCSVRQALKTIKAPHYFL